MKKTTLILLASILCAFSCSKEGAVPAGDNGAAVIFDIALNDTKIQTNPETFVNRLQVGLYDAAGNLEWDNTYEYAFNTVKTVTGLTEGMKTIVAVANKAVTMPATLEEFYRIPVRLTDNRRDAFVMSGTATAEAMVSPGITTIHLNRLVAKVTVRASLTTSFNDGKKHEFIPERIYLSNVAVKTDLRGEAYDEFINLREELNQTEEETLKDFTVADRDYWLSGAVFNHGLDFYVCPNTSSERKTALIIRALYDGRRCYYPLVVADTLSFNTLYRCGMIVVSCEGMPNPGDEFTSIRTRFEYLSEDWSVGETDDRIVYE